MWQLFLSIGIISFIFGASIALLCFEIKKRKDKKYAKKELNKQKTEVKNGSTRRPEEKPRQDNERKSGIKNAIRKLRKTPTSKEHTNREGGNELPTVSSSIRDKGGVDSDEKTSGKQ